VLMTVWDGGGNATYDLSNYTTNQSVDLNPGQWVVLDTSSAQLQRADLGNNGAGGPEYFARGNIANALIDPNNPNEATSLIKNVILGSGTDTVIGNHANNKVDGGGGQDTFVETGNHTDHSFTLLSTGYVQIQDLRPGSPDGTDLIKSVQLVQFSDGTFKVGLLAPNFALLQQDATNFLLAENAGGNVNPVLAEAAVNGPLTQLLKDLGNNVTNLMTSTDASVPASVLANLTVPVTQILSDALFQSPNLTADNTTLIGVANLIGHGYHVV
jgi:Peptidase M10 serralysin C terminal